MATKSVDAVSVTMTSPNDKVITEESKARLHVARAVPPLAIKLKNLYEFNVSDDERTASLIGDRPIVENSFLATKHHLSYDVGNEVRLTKNQTIHLPPGITGVLGRSGAGKSKLALGAINALNPRCAYVRYGEPLDKFFVALMDMDPAEARAELLFFEADLAARIASFLFNDTEDVLLIDSLRYWVFASGGSTGKGGVNMSMFTELSFLDIVANLRGKSIVALINPLADDDVGYKFMLDVAKGSFSAVIDVQSPVSVRFSSRYDDRDYMSFRLPETPKDSSPLTLKAKSQSTSSLTNYIK